MSGPPRSPRALRLLRGTLQPCRDDVPATPGELIPHGVPTPPGWMSNLEALREWHRLAGPMHACRLLHTGTLAGFTQFCAIAGELASIWASGKAPSGSMLSAHRRLSNDLFGQRVPPTPPPAEKENRFARNALKVKGRARRG